MSVLNVTLPASLYSELQAVSTEEEVSVDQLVALAVAEKLAARRVYKQLASGDLSARKTKLAGRSREALRADFEALMEERQNQTPIQGDEWPANP